jgi:hypothetical protein
LNREIEEFFVQNVMGRLVWLDSTESVSGSTWTFILNSGDSTFSDPIFLSWRIIILSVELVHDLLAWLGWFIIILDSILNTVFLISHVTHLVNGGSPSGILILVMVDNLHVVLVENAKSENLLLWSIFLAIFADELGELQVDLSTDLWADQIALVDCFDVGKFENSNRCEHGNDAD